MKKNNEKNCHRNTTEMNECIAFDISKWNKCVSEATLFSTICTPTLPMFKKKLNKAQTRQTEMSWIFILFCNC